jgi:hypothetical protein
MNKATTALAYPSECEITPKMIRDALRGLDWPAKRWEWRVTYEDGLKERYLGKRDWMRELTIDYVALPVVWYCVTAMWNSRRNRRTRELFAVDSEAALRDFASWFCIHLMSADSPLARLQRLVVRRGVTPTEEQARAWAREADRKAATEQSVSALVESARVSPDRVDFDAAHLFGALTTYKNEYVRFRSGTMVATVKRCKLDEARIVMRDKPHVSACVGTFRDGYCLSLRWRNSSGTNGGLNLTVNEDVHESRCTVVDFSAAPVAAPVTVAEAPPPVEAIEVAPEPIPDPPPSAPEAVPESGVRVMGEQKLVPYTPKFRERTKAIAATLGVQAPALYTLGAKRIGKGWLQDFAKTLRITRVVFRGSKCEFEKYKALFTLVDSHAIHAGCDDSAASCIREAIRDGDTPLLVSAAPKPRADRRHEIARRIAADGALVWHCMPTIDEIVDASEFQRSIDEGGDYTCYGLKEWLSEQGQEAKAA